METILKQMEETNKRIDKLSEQMEKVTELLDTFVNLYIHANRLYYIFEEEENEYKEKDE